MCLYSWIKPNDVAISQVVVSNTKGNTTKNVIMDITAIVSRCRNLDILLSEKGRMYLLNKTSKHRSLVQARQSCYLSCGLVENGTKIVNVVLFTLTIHCFYYRTSCSKDKLSHSAILVNNGKVKKIPKQPLKNRIKIIPIV